MCRYKIVMPKNDKVHKVKKNDKNLSEDNVETTCTSSFYKESTYTISEKDWHKS